ncbi:MAG TPA: sugar porter family MFS transporter [Bryobacteraceae bacterium]|nr:sugar porter family MFS transporter [Bryobacteraceae bacterium]
MIDLPPGMSSATSSTSLEAGSWIYVFLAATVAATAGLLFGFDIAVINGGIVFLQAALHLTSVQTEFAVSALLFGCIFGASIAGWLSDRFGRRRVLMLCAVLFALSAIGAALPRTLTEFVTARIVGGLAIGAASVLAPLYIAEVAPARDRGRLVSLNQMAIVTGILLAYLANWLLSFTGPSSWRWMFAVAAIPSAAFFIGLFFVPESPRWLVEMGRSAEALVVLTSINGPITARHELTEIEQTVAEESGTLAELFQPGLRRALWIAIALAVLQQVTGINTVLFYGSIIFKEQVHSGSNSAAIFANVIVGLINFLATLIALNMIDKFGRRPLLLVSSGVMALCQVGLAAVFLIPAPPAALVLAIMLACVASFAIGLGPGVWVLIAEFFPTRIRGRAMSIATVSLWAACTLLTMTFLTLAKALTPSGAFLIYAAMCVITFLIVLRAVPETKGRTLEEIEHLWRPSGSGG